MITYLALDQALQTSGWAIYGDGRLLDCGIFKTHNTIPIEERLGEVFTELTKLHDRYSFNYVFFEDIQKQQNVETYKKLCYVQAVVLLWCYFEQIDFDILSPSHWRSIIKDKYKVNFGKTRAEQKAAAQKFVKEHFNIDVTEDECDAICLGLAGLEEFNKHRSAF